MLLSLLIPSIKFELNKHFFIIIDTIIDTGKSSGMEIFRREKVRLGKVRAGKISAGKSPAGKSPAGKSPGRGKFRRGKVRRGKFRLRPSYIPLDPSVQFILHLTNILILNRKGSSKKFL